MPTSNGIPSISDYSHWNEDAERVWYEENKYDMAHPEDWDDPYESHWDEPISEEECYRTKKHAENINSISQTLLGPTGDIRAEELGYCDDCEMELHSSWNPQGYTVRRDYMPSLVELTTAAGRKVSWLGDGWFAVYERKVT